MEWMEHWKDLAEDWSGDLKGRHVEDDADDIYGIGWAEDAKGAA